MINEKKCSLKVFDGDKVLSGTAAQIKHISNKGGWDKFINDLAFNVAADTLKRVNEDASRTNLRLVK